VSPSTPPFTYQSLEREYEKCLEEGYQVLTCSEYPEWKKSGSRGKVLVNRIDVDFSIKKVIRLADIFSRFDIHGTFFIRLHAPEYNPFSFESYRIIQGLVEAGHEIGYHSEIVDESIIWNEDAAACLKRDIEVFNSMFGVNIEGVASHGGMTGNNNLDFWSSHKPEEFGLKYEAYDRQPAFNLFWESRYISDSEWTRWKSYECGRRIVDDERPPSGHAREGCQVLYTLIHSDTYFDRHFYE
jgi:hypothetical protein